jgi:hypothetical protein
MLVLAAGITAEQPSTADVQAIAEEAFIFAYPMLENYQRFFRGGFAPDATMNRFVHARQLAGSQSRNVIRPNNDTLYSSTWLDLRAAPMVITMPATPDGRYWSLQLIDIYTHNPAVLSPRNSPSTGAQFIVAGPSWTGAAPPATKVVRVESQFVFALVRIAVMGPDDLPNVAKLQDQIRLAPLDSAATAAPKLAFPPFSREKADSEGFIEYVNFLLGQLAVDPSEKALMTRFVQIGIGANRPFDGPALDSTTRGAIRLGVQSALAKINGRGALAERRGAWTTSGDAFGDRARMQGRYLQRSAAARWGLYGLDREEAVYMNAGADADGRPLDASKSSYVLRFDKSDIPPAGAFWSITMYGDDGFLVANPKQRYSIGDRTPGLVRDADGSLSLYISASSPGGLREANWLPAPPGRFSLALRIYLPQPAVEKYSPPPVREVR